MKRESGTRVVGDGEGEVGGGGGGDDRRRGFATAAAQRGS